MIVYKVIIVIVHVIMFVIFSRIPGMRVEMAVPMTAVISPVTSPVRIFVPEAVARRTIVWIIRIIEPTYIIMNNSGIMTNMIDIDFELTWSQDPLQSSVTFHS